MRDETISLAAADFSSPISTQPREKTISPFEKHAGVLLDHDYLPSSLTGLVENAIVYIAGFVVRKLYNKIDCSCCKDALLATPGPKDHTFHLLKLKNNGGLIMPSEGTIKILKTAERCFRQTCHLSKVTSKCSLALLNKAVKCEIGSKDIFNLEEHITNTQDGINNHHYTLISQITRTFFRLRQFHISKLHTLQLQKENTRQKLTKAITFRGH